MTQYESHRRQLGQDTVKMRATQASGPVSACAQGNCKALCLCRCSGRASSVVFKMTPAAGCYEHRADHEPEQQSRKVRALGKLRET